MLIFNSTLLVVFLAASGYTRGDASRVFGISTRACPRVARYLQLWVPFWFLCYYTGLNPVVPGFMAIGLGLHEIVFNKTSIKLWYSDRTRPGVGWLWGLYPFVAISYGIIWIIIN